MRSPRGLQHRVLRHGHAGVYPTPCPRLPRTPFPARGVCAHTECARERERLECAREPGKVPSPATLTGGAGHAAQVRTTSHCLHVLGNTEMAEYGKAALPSDMSSKFRVCTELAAAVKKLGYREEISFHLFLYPAEKSSRELVTFLMDRIPQAMRGGEGGGDMAGDKAIAMRNVTAALSAAAARMHVLPVCRPRTLRAAVDKPAGWAYPSVPLRTVALLVPPGEGGCSGYFDSEGLPAVTQQAWGPHGLAPSLFEANLLAQEKKKEINLDSSADDLAQAKAAFDKNIKEALRAASGKSKGKARDSIASLASLLEEWVGAKGPSHSSRFGRAAAFGQERILLLI